MNKWLPVPDGPGTWLVRIRPHGEFDIAEGDIAESMKDAPEWAKKNVASCGMEPSEPALVEIVPGQTRFDADRFGGSIYEDHGCYEWKRVGPPAAPRAKEG